MPATTCFHDGVPQPVLQEADFVLDDPVAFPPTNHVFNTDSNGGNTTIRCLLRGGEFSSRRLFLGLDNRDVLQAASLEAFILIETTARRPGIGRELCQALLRGVAFRGMAQKAHVTGLMNHEEVFQCVTLPLPTVIALWLFRIGWAGDRTFSAIMPTRGMVALPSVACVLNIAANSAAVRAGSRSGSEKA